jgi:DNA topoisomerase II
LEQCVMELITNATDRAQNPDNGVTKIDVSITNDVISVTNDGISIPIEIHDKHNIYIPELVFGNMLSSSNFKKGVKRTVGGKNGIGAKAANIFSSKFVVTVINKGKKYVQVFEDQMRKTNKPKITKSKAKDSVTIDYTPAYKVFGMESLDQNDTKNLIEKRTIDASAVTGDKVIVTFNGKKVATKKFEDYINLYIGNKTESPRVFVESERWAVAFALNPYPNAVQVSFVNGIGTEDGGSHVAHVIEPVLNRVVKELSEKHKDLTIRKSYIRDNIIVFVKSVIENPTFTSQTKREHTTRPMNFGSRLQLSDDTIKKITKLGITKGITELARAKDMQNLKKLDGKKVLRLIDIEKLDDANFAGGPRSSECTLILTEVRQRRLLFRVLVLLVGILMVYSH